MDFSVSLPHKYYVRDEYRRHILKIESLQDFGRQW